MKLVPATASCCKAVRPLAGAGIEITWTAWAGSWKSVRPLAGAGIEIGCIGWLRRHSASFAPSRGRELKYASHAARNAQTPVRPLAGAGIEISRPSENGKSRFVRPLAGAGIEIPRSPWEKTSSSFAPSRGRELKYYTRQISSPLFHVRPLAGAGIEIATTAMTWWPWPRSPPRGGGN